MGAGSGAVRNVNKKIICILLGDYYEQCRGGAEYQAYLLAGALKERGHDVHYIYVDNGWLFEKRLDIHLHPIKRPKFAKRYLRHYAAVLDAPRILRVLKKVNPDVVYQRTGTAYTGIAAYFCKANGKQLIWHVALDRDVVRVPWTIGALMNGSVVENRVQVWGVRRADMIICQAHYQAKALKRNYGLECEAVIPNFHPVPMACVAKPDWPIRITWVANLKSTKRPTLFLELVEAMGHAPGIEFCMVGRVGPQYRAAIAEQGRQSSNFNYLGELSQDEVNVLLARSHIFVNTSESEGFPNTFIQAWLRGVPVVSLTVDPDDVIKRFGLGFCSGSFEQMTRDCKLLSSESGLRNEIGARAYKYAIENHTLERGVERILRVFGVIA